MRPSGSDPCVAVAGEGGCSAGRSGHRARALHSRWGGDRTRQTPDSPSRRSAAHRRRGGPLRGVAAAVAGAAIAGRPGGPDRRRGAGVHRRAAAVLARHGGLAAGRHTVSPAAQPGCRSGPPGNAPTPRTGHDDGRLRGGAGRDGRCRQLSEGAHRCRRAPAVRPAGRTPARRDPAALRAAGVWAEGSARHVRGFAPHRSRAVPGLRRVAQSQARVSRGAGLRLHAARDAWRSRCLHRHRARGRRPGLRRARQRCGSGSVRRQVHRAAAAEHSRPRLRPGLRAGPQRSDRASRGHGRGHLVGRPHPGFRRAPRSRIPDPRADLSAGHRPDDLGAATPRPGRAGLRAHLRGRHAARRARRRRQQPRLRPPAQQRRRQVRRRVRCA